jgi:thioredoxin-dependent peroxiredoxin
VPSPIAGEAAPDFTLPGTGGRDYTLSDFRGRPVVLVFYPGDDTPVCTAQLRSYSDGMAAFDQLDAQVLAISPQDVASHERFAREYGLRMPLLADTELAVANRYEILGPLGFYRRSVFVVDAGGVVRFARRSLTSLSFIDSGQLLSAVRETSPSETG